MYYVQILPVSQTELPHRLAYLVAGFGRRLFLPKSEFTHRLPLNVAEFNQRRPRYNVSLEFGPSIDGLQRRQFSGVGLVIAGDRLSALPPYFLNSSGLLLCSDLCFRYTQNTSWGDLFSGIVASPVGHEPSTLQAFDSSSSRLGPLGALLFPEGDGFESLCCSPEKFLFQACTNFAKLVIWLHFEAMCD